MITLQSVKTRLQIKNNNHDEYITEMIPDMVEFSKDYCNNLFLDVDGNEVLPSGVILFVAKAIQYLMNEAGMTQQKMGDVNFSYESDFPPALLRLLKPYKRVKFV